jgi:hypothetical protein
MCANMSGDVRTNQGILFGNHMQAMQTDPNALFFAARTEAVEQSKKRTYGGRDDGNKTQFNPDQEIVCNFKTLGLFNRCGIASGKVQRFANRYEMEKALSAANEIRAEFKERHNNEDPCQGKRKFTANFDSCGYCVAIFGQM